MDFYFRDHLPYGSSEIIFQIAEKLLASSIPRPWLKIKKIPDK